jgi:tetratricopeptide (TPR) repeat protein
LRAFELDPFSLLVRNALVQSLWRLGRRDEAVELGEGTLEMYPGNATVLSGLIVGYAMQGKHADALETLEKRRSMVNATEERLDAYRRTKATSGFPGVMEAFALAMESGNAPDYRRAFMTAEYYALAGRHEDALRWLERAYEARDPDFSMFVNGHPLFATLRSDPRFQDLLRRMNYPVD